MEELLCLQWGEGEGRVGVRDAPEGRFGPQAVSVDEDRGRLHVLDSVNARVLTFALDGAPIHAFPVPALAEDIAVLPGGELAVLVPAAASIECVTFAGVPCGRAALPLGGPPARGFRKLEGRVPVLWRPDNTVIPLSDRDSGGSAPASLLATAASAAASPRASPITVLRSRDGAATFATAPPPDRALRRADVPPQCGRVESVAPVGRDAADRVYVAVEETCGGTIARFLEVFSALGDPVATAEVPSSSFAFVYRDLELSRDGRVFQLVVRPDGAAVLRWSVASGAPAPGGRSLEIYPPRRSTPALPPDSAEDPAPADARLEMPSSAGDTPATAVSQQEVMRRALAYAAHTYAVRSANLTPPGGDSCGGKLVTTPEWLRVGAPMTGLPYKWGGFTGLEDASLTSVDPDCAGTGTSFFDAALDAGRLAGDTCASTCSGMYCGSHCAVGVDCSGYVSQAWGLPGQVTTSALPSSPYTCPSPLRSLDLLLAGDVLNRAGSHARLFAARSPSGSIEVLEASGRDWKVAAHSYDVGELAAYLPYRKRAIAGLFAVGERVVANDDGVEVRPCTDAGSPACAPVGEVGRGQLGTIAAGPEERGGHLWWSIAWQGAPEGWEGWTVQCSLAKEAVDESVDVVLAAEPAAGHAPLGAMLTATVTGTATGPIAYAFWWDCPAAAAGVAEAMSQCGNLAMPPAGTCTTPDDVGYRCNGVWDNPKTVAHTFTGTGTFAPKVIVERGGVAADSRTVVSVQASCSFTLTPAQAGFAWGAASGSLAVDTQAGCAWTASTGDDWIHLLTESGINSGTVRFSLAANTSAAPRAGAIVVHGLTFSVSQAALRPVRTRLSSS